MLISFKKERLVREFAESITSRLRFILYAAAGWTMQKYGYGIKITELLRTPEENEAVGGVFNSKHLANAQGLAEAADFVFASGKVPLEWDNELKAFLDASLDGVDVVIIPHGTAAHVHLEVDPQPPTNPVVIV